MPLNADFDSAIQFLNTIFSDNNTPKKPITDFDLKDADLAAIQERTKTYTKYLKNYVLDYEKKTNTQRKMKGWFFALVMMLLFVIISASFISLIIIASKKTVALADITTLITAMVSSISSFLVLPKVIADNLFPSKEEDKTSEIFSKMFEHDINLRGMYHISENIEQASKEQLHINSDSEE